MLLKDFLVNFFVPTQSLAYYAIYFHFWRSIYYEKKRLHIFLLRCLLMLIAAHILKYLLTDLLAPSRITRIVLVDAIHLMYSQLRGFSFLTSLILIMTLALLYLNYFKCDAKINELAYGILFNNKWDTYIWSTYRRIHVCKYTQQFAVKCLLMAPIFTVAFCKFFFGKKRF